jgi:hypothetical protein
MKFVLCFDDYVCERLIGFSIPVENEVAVISYESIHIVPLTQPRIIRNYEDFAEGGDAYDSRNQILHFHDRCYSMLGLHGGTPKLGSRNGERLIFSSDNQFQVLDPHGNEIFRHQFNDLSGDWKFITLSEDDNYILLGLPYSLQIFQRVS